MVLKDVCWNAVRKRTKRVVRNIEGELAMVDVRKRSEIRRGRKDHLDGVEGKQEQNVKNSALEEGVSSGLLELV